MIVVQILVVGSLGNVKSTVRRTCILIVLGSEGLMTANLTWITDFISFKRVFLSIDFFSVDNLTVYLELNHQ